MSKDLFFQNDLEYYVEYIYRNEEYLLTKEPAIFYTRQCWEKHVVKIIPNYKDYGYFKQRKILDNWFLIFKFHNKTKETLWLLKN